MTTKPFVRRYLDHWVVIIPLPFISGFILESHVQTWKDAITVALARANRPEKLVDLLPFMDTLAPPPQCHSKES